MTAVTRIELKVKNRREQTAFSTPNHLLFVSHPHVYTLGKSGDLSNLLISNHELEAKGVHFYKINRGGDITYHGPGQLICYFVIDLRKRKKDIRKFISKIEKTIIQTLKFYKIDTFSDKKNIGIWFKDNEQIKKVAAIGVRVSKWIAYHGFSINIENNLEKYKAIIPCGISNRGVTNLKKIKDQNYDKLEDKLIEYFISNL